MKSLVGSVLVLLLLANLTVGCKSRPRPTLALSSQKQMTLVADATFQNAFAADPQCNGITLLTNGESKADFVVFFDFDKKDWIWWMSYPRDPEPANEAHPAHGTGGMGYQEKPEDAVRDVCLTIWDDVHAPYPVNPGGKVQ